MGHLTLQKSLINLAEPNQALLQPLKSKFLSAFVIFVWDSVGSTSAVYKMRALHLPLTAGGKTLKGQMEQDWILSIIFSITHQEKKPVMPLHIIQRHPHHIHITAHLGCWNCVSAQLGAISSKTTYL